MNTFISVLRSARMFFFYFLTFQIVPSIMFFVLTKDIYHEMNGVSHCFTKETFICFRFMWLNGSIHFLSYFNYYFIPIKSIK